MDKDKKKNLSSYNPEDVPSAKDIYFGIVVADWNSEITNKLLEGTVNTLKKYGADEENIVVKHVPGSFEITYGAKALNDASIFDAIICLGCVIQGETKHFDYICQSVTHGITELNLHNETPFIFGVLTTNTYQQAKDRAGGKYGNKGDEAAVSAIKMANLKLELEDEYYDDEETYDDEESFDDNAFPFN